MLLKGKSIVVTGGSTGIGKAIVLAAAAEGANVADFDKVLAVNLKSAFFGAWFAAQQFVTQRSGELILTISSTHEDSPMPGNIVPGIRQGRVRQRHHGHRRRRPIAMEHGPVTTTPTAAGNDHYDVLVIGIG